MEDDAAAETTSINFSLVLSNGSGDVAGGSCTGSPPSDDNGIMRAGRGDVHHPMPAIQVPKPTRPQPPTSSIPALRAALPPSSSTPFGDEASDGGAPSPAASPASAHVAKSIRSFQAIHPAELPCKGHVARSSLEKDVSLDFVRAVQRLDSEDFQRSRRRSTNSGGDDDDDSDHSGNGVSAKRRCQQGAAGTAINKGERTTQAPAQSPSPTAPSRQLLVPPQQPTRASNVTATTSTLIATTANETINFEEEKNDDADDTMAAPVAAAAPPSRTSAVEQAALPPPQVEHQRPGTALTPSTKPRATAHESPPPLSSTTTGTTPLKNISGPKPQTPTSPPAQQPRNEHRRSSPSSSRNTSPGYTVSAATAATITGAADVGGATLPTASLASPGRIALPDADPQHYPSHLRVLSSSMQNEDDPMYCTVSEMTMANPVTPRGGVSLPLLGLNTGLQQARGASGGSLYLSPARLSLRPAAAGRRVQSSDFSFDESNVLLTLNTPREVVKSATAGAKESTYFRDAAFEDGAEPASASTRSQSMLGLHGKPLPSSVQPALVKRTADGRTTAGGGRLSPPASLRQLPHPSAPPAIAAELKRHAEREGEGEKEHTLRPTSTPSPRETRVGGEGAHRGRRSASSIFKSFPSKTVCGRSRNSVAAKSGVDEHGEGGGEGRDVKTSGRSTSSIQSTRSSSFASGLSRLSSMFKRLVSGAAHGSVEAKTQRPLQPSSSSLQQQQQQRRTRQHEDNAATTTAVAALVTSTLGNTVKTTDSSANLRSADTQVGRKQRQPPPAVTPAVASATAFKPGRATPTREITSSWHGDSINFPTDEEEDRGLGDGVVGVAPLIPPAAAVPAIPVEGASGSAEASMGQRPKKDAEHPVRRRRRRRRHDAEAQDGTSSSASAAGGDDRRSSSSSSSSAGDVDTSSSSTPLTSASGAKKPRRRRRETARRSGPRRHRHRREGRKQQNEQANGVSKCLQDRPSPSTPPLKSESSDTSASSDGRLDRSSRHLSQRGCRQRCDANDRGLAASGKALATRKANQRRYRRALRGDGESSRTFRRPCEGARHHNATDDSCDRGDAGDLGGSFSRDCHGDVVPPPIASAAILAARRRELRTKSRVTSSVNHFAVSRRTRPATRHRQELLRHAGHASLARLQKRDGERTSGSEKAAAVAAEAVAASRRASPSQLWASPRQTAVKSHQNSTAPLLPQPLTPGRLEQYEAALTRDILELDVIVEKRRRRELWAEASPEAAAAAAAAEAVATPSRRPLRGAAQRRAMTTPARTAGPLPSRVGITTVVTASTPTRTRRSSAGNTRAAHRYNGPIASACRSHPNDYGSSNANELESAAADGRGSGDSSSTAPPTPRAETIPSPSISSPLLRVRTAAGVRWQPQQRPSASVSCTSHIANAASVLAAVRRPGAADCGNEDAEAAPHHSSSTRLPGDAARVAMMALQRRYEQLLEDIVAQPAPQPPAAPESDEGDNATDDEVLMKAHSRHNYSARRHQYPHQHLSREQGEGERNRGVVSSSSTRGRRSAPAPTQVDAMMEAEEARCSAALRAEYYQPPQHQHNQQQEPSKTMERVPLPPATHEAGADTVPVAHVAAPYAQALRPSCAACRPQQLSEYITVGLLSMMRGGADECVDTGAVAASGNAANLRRAHARPVTTPTLVQRRIREDLYAAPRRCSRRRMTQADGKQKATCSDGNTAAAPPITSVSASCGVVLSSMHAQSADAAAAGRDVGLSPQAGTAPLPPAQLTHSFTPTPVVIDSALLTRLMRRERRARCERASQEQEARYTLQRLYIVETVLVLRAMGKAAAMQEQEAPAAPALPTSQALASAATAPVNDRGGNRSGSRCPLAATRSSGDVSVEADGGAAREPVAAIVSVSQQPREEASASEEEHSAAAAVVVVCGDAAAAAAAGALHVTPASQGGEGKGTRSESACAAVAPLPMRDTTARSLAGDASEMRSEVEVDTVERDADDSSSSAASPAVLVAPSPQAAVATKVGGEVKQAKDHGGDVDVAESSSSNRSASSVLSFHVEDSQEGAALQHPGPGSDGADKDHYPVAASGSSAAAAPAAAAQPSSDESTSPVTAAVEGLATPSTTSPQAAEVRPLSIDRGEPITDSDRHGTLDDVKGAVGTVDDALDGHAAASPPSAGKHANAAPHRSPPPVPSSSSAASAASSSPSRNLHVVEVVEAARATTLVPEGEGAVDASHNADDAGATDLEAVARAAIQTPVTPVEATTSTALASAAAAEAILESEPSPSAGDDPRRALEGPRPRQREQRQQQKMATASTRSAVPASPRRVRFSLQPEVLSSDDGEVKEVSGASKQTCWEGRATSPAAGGPQTMTPEPFKRAAAAKDDLAIDLLEKLNGLDALLLHSFPTYFTTGTDEDGLPGVVMRPHRHPPFVSPRPLQPCRSAPSQHLSDSMPPLAEGRETPPASAAGAAAADASPFDAHASALCGHRTPPRLPPGSLASQLRRKYGVPQPVQQRRHDDSAELTLGLPAAATPSIAAAPSTPPSASASGSWPSAVPAAERPSPQEGIDASHLAARRSVWF